MGDFKPRGSFGRGRSSSRGGGGSRGRYFDSGSDRGGSDRGGRGFSRGGGGGFRGSSRGGEGFRGSSRGRGGFGDSPRGFRGSRGGFRGAPRGGDGFRGSFRGGSGFGGGRGRGDYGRDGPSLVNKPKDAVHPSFEIGDGLTLLVNFKNSITDLELKTKLKDLHAVTGSKKDGKSYLLFKSFEATEKGHKKLSSDETVESVEFCGFRAPKGNDEMTKLVVNFENSVDESAIKDLHELILAVTPFSNKPNCYFLEFPSSADAMKAEKDLFNKKRESGIAFVRYSQGLRNNIVNKLQTMPNSVCLRDVPKTSTLQELVALAPAAVGVRVYKNTFPASDYCHAAIEFSTTEEATSFISEYSGSLKLSGKKIYVLPGLKTLMSDGPTVGEKREGQENKREREKKKEEKASKEEPKAKKTKLDVEEKSDNDESGEETAEDEDDDDEEGEDESDEGEEGENGDAEEGEENGDEDDSEEGDDEEESDE